MFNNLKLRSSLTALLCITLAGVGVGADSFDSDGDGFDDNTDNCTLTANPDQRDTNADGYGNLCDGDFNDDAQTDFSDLAIMKTMFFSASPDSDLDGDGNVNFNDLGQLKSMFFTAPGPTGDNPEVPICNCYFSGDCTQEGQFCDWGDEGFTIELSCLWRDPKPTAPGNGCSTEYVGPWGPICDGFCTDAEAGSSIGGEARASIAQAVRLWSDAMIGPSRRGGGPVEQSLADAARALPFGLPHGADVVGRHTADMIGIAAGRGFYDYFCHFEHHPAAPDEGLYVDLSDDSCRLEAAALTADALVAEVANPGAAGAIVSQIPARCPQWQSMFAPRCPDGPDALSCFTEMVQNLAVFMTTPRSGGKQDSFIKQVMGR